MNASRISLALTLLVLSNSASANDGYLVDTGGHVVHGGDGACWHTVTWAPEKAILGCDGKSASPPAPPRRPPSPPPPRAPAPVAAVSADTDRDGVIDDHDKCAETPSGVKVDVAGCPLDPDADGVADYLDKCPDTPAGAVVDEVGCPKKLDREVTIDLDVTFVTDKADIQGDATGEIQKVADFMKRYPGVDVVIEGYTDNQGGTLKNKKLSQKRAEAVKAALVAGGIFATRLTAVGFGPTNPIADNKTVEGRAKNRRVVAHAKAETEIVEMKK